jgi:hypothetical protein
MPGDNNILWEAFVTGTEPNNDNYVLDTSIIGADDYNINDPEGINQFGYEDYPTQYQDQNVEIYNPFPEDENADNPFSYFQNKQNQRSNATNPNQERVMPAPKTPVQPSLGNNEDGGFNGTGGFY